MHTTHTRSAALALVLAAVSGGSIAQADIFDDILSIATAARDRATQARDNAATARDRATQARDNAATARDNAAAARDNAATAVANAAAARDTAVQVRDELIESAGALTASVRAFVDEAAADLEQEVEDELAGRDEFLNGGLANSFRQSLLAMVASSETLINTLNDACGAAGAHVDFTREMVLINAMPDRLLFPLYRAMVHEAPGMLEWFEDLLARAAADVQLIGGLLTEDSEPIQGNLLDQEEHDCAYVLDHLAEIRGATSDLNKFSMAARGLGAVLKGAGTTEIEKNGALWGWAGGSIKNNHVKKLGILIDGLGTGVGGLTGYVSGKTRYCAAIGIEVEARERDFEIMANQEKILRALGVQSPTSRTRP